MSESSVLSLRLTSLHRSFSWSQLFLRLLSATGHRLPAPLLRWLRSLHRVLLTCRVPVYSGHIGRGFFSLRRESVGERPLGGAQRLPLWRLAWRYRVRSPL